MTDLITRDPNDTGEIIRAELEETQNLGPKIAAALANISPNLRSAAATEVITICEEPILVNPARPATLEDATLTGEILALDTGGYPKPSSLPKPPKGWNVPAGEHPIVRPRDGRDPGRHRARTPVGWWLAAGFGLLVAGWAAGVINVLAVTQ